MAEEEQETKNCLRELDQLNMQELDSKESFEY